jgi:hypothetical protein
LTRSPGYATPEGQRWLTQLSTAQREVEDAERERDELALEALAAGLGVRGVAIALGIDKGTVSRRYSNGSPR